jgi:hypothetical protein
MSTKLTLKIDEGVIERAKNYAKIHNTSVSILVEVYLQKVTNPSRKSRITPLVKSLSGLIDLPNDYDHKKDYSEYLKNKYK